MSIPAESVFSRIKGTLLLAIVLLILGLITWDRVFPRTQQLSPAAMQGIIEITDQLKTVANTMEKSTQAMNTFNENLKDVYELRESQNKRGYDDLYDRYGEGLDLSSTANPAIGLFPPPLSFGSRHVPGSQGAASTAQPVQKPGESVQGATDERPAVPPQSTRGDAAKSAG